MSHDINLPFEQFEKYNLSLTIIAKQQELIELMHHRNNADKIKAAEKAIRFMIEKLIKESDPASVLKAMEEYASQFKKELNVPTDEDIEKWMSKQLFNNRNWFDEATATETILWMRDEIIKRNK